MDERVVNQFSRIKKKNYKLFIDRFIRLERRYQLMVLNLISAIYLSKRLYKNWRETSYIDILYNLENEIGSYSYYKDYVIPKGRPKVSKILIFPFLYLKEEEQIIIIDIIENVLTLTSKKMNHPRLVKDKELRWNTFQAVQDDFDQAVSLLL